MDVYSVERGGGSFRPMDASAFGISRDWLRAIIFPNFSLFPTSRSFAPQWQPWKTSCFGYRDGAARLRVGMVESGRDFAFGFADILPRIPILLIELAYFDHLGA
jgi:hypothetical protein